MKPKRALFLTRSAALVCCWCLASAGAAGGAEVLEIAPGQEGQLPQGKEADGIRGDFVLRNDMITALISHNAPLRRANMSTFYGADGVTPGCLYDLALREGENDQLTYFGPTGQKGEVSYVKAVDGSPAGEAAVETVVAGAKNGGLYKRHEYRMRDGVPGVWITTLLRNEGAAPVKASTKDNWTRFNETGEHEGVIWADAVDSRDRVGYAYGAVAVAGDSPAPTAATVELAPGAELKWTRFLAVGRSPLEAWAAVQKVKGVPVGRLTVALLEDGAGTPAQDAALYLPAKGAPIPARPDLNGKLSLELPAGDHRFVMKDLGRPDGELQVQIAAGETVERKETVPPATRVKFDIRDAEGRSLPCKVQFLAQGDTAPVNLGPVMRAHGCVDQYHSEKGDFTVQIPSGTYEVVVTRGIEYAHHRQQVVLAQGQQAEVNATLKRLVDTTGWISTDFHNHSTPSGDNICGTPDRVINIAAEHLEFAPTTEHNRIYDWRPTIEKLGLAGEIQTVTGMELTGAGSHFNSFPLDPVPHTQDGGAPVWNADPRITALTLRGWQKERPDRWIQVNHPDLSFLYTDRYADGVADGGYHGITEMVDGMETENFVGEGILADSPWRLSRTGKSLATRVEYVRQFIWLQLLNQGHRIHPVAVADAHTVHGNGVGGWRMYLPSKTDDPAKIDWTNDLSAHAKAGHYLLTTGPFMQVSAGSGNLPGDDVRYAGPLPLHVKVQCTDWVEFDRVQILVNGRKDPVLNFTKATHPEMFKEGVVRFDEVIPVRLERDAHLIVVALSEKGDLKTGYGTSRQASLRPMAYHTPFYVDVDGHGFQPNGDDLGFEVPVAKMTPDQVKSKLGNQENAAPASPAE